MQFDVRTMTGIFGISDYLKLALHWGVPIGILVTLWFFRRNARRLQALRAASLGRSVSNPALNEPAAESRPDGSSEAPSDRGRPL